MFYAIVVGVVLVGSVVTLVWFYCCGEANEKYDGQCGHRDCGGCKDEIMDATNPLSPINPTSPTNPMNNGSMW